MLRKPQTTLCHDDGLYLEIKKKEHIGLDVLYSTESLSLNRCSHGLTSFLTRCAEDSLPLPTKKWVLQCQSALVHPLQTFFVGAKYIEWLKARKFQLHFREKRAWLSSTQSVQETTRQPCRLTTIRWPIYKMSKQYICGAVITTT
jgi:hypothetical protein